MPFLLHNVPTAMAQVNGSVVDDQITLRVGYLGLYVRFFGTDGLAAFLAATQLINSDPGTFLGNSSFQLETHVTSEVIPGVPYADLIDVLRSEMQLVGRPTCYKPVVSAHPALASPPALDVHALLVGSWLGSGMAEVSRLSEFAQTPLLTFGAPDDMLSNKTRFPTHSRMTASTKQEAMALAELAAGLGVQRIGIIYTASTFGQSFRVHFTAKCAALNVAVAATIAVAPILSAPPSQKSAVLADFTQNLAATFQRENVRVYLVAIDSSDLGPAIIAMNASGRMGPGNVILLPSSGMLLATAPVANPVHAAGQALLAGSIGVYPSFPSAGQSTALMWGAWPTTADNWTSLLETNAKTANLTLPQPTTTLARLQPWARYIWDGTFLLARALADSWSECGGGNSSSGHPEIHCLLNRIRSTTVNGTTGDFVLNADGDRLGDFGVFNVHNRQLIPVGALSTSGSLTLNAKAIVWSDGVQNRSAMPSWGQTPHASTPSPTTAVVRESKETQNATAVYVSVGLTLILMVIGVVAAGLRYDAKRRKLRPADFHKVIEKLKENVGPLDFSAHGDPGGKIGSTALHKRLDGGRRIGVDTARRIVSLSDSQAGLDNGGGAGHLNVPSELNRKDVVVEEVLGTGNFGQVCRGTLVINVDHVKTQIPVAIKMVEDHKEAQNTFLEEAAVTWQFQHPNVVGMYGVVTSGHPFLLLLELCDEGELLKYLQDKKRDHSIATLMRILKEVASGMRYLSSKHFVHRDLAARNVLLDSESRAKVCDFGLGRNFQGDEYYRVSSETLLPIRWTDPWAVMNQVFSEATDVWSFGITAIEIFSNGARPYGSWPNLMIVESVKSGYRLPCPAAMPHEVYTAVVLPCWFYSPMAKATAEGISTVSSVDTFGSRATFADIDDELHRICSDPSLWSNEDGQEMHPESPQGKGARTTYEGEYMSRSRVDNAARPALYALTDTTPVSSGDYIPRAEMVGVDQSLYAPDPTIEGVRVPDEAVSVFPGHVSNGSCSNEYVTYGEHRGCEKDDGDHKTTAAVVTEISLLTNPTAGMDFIVPATTDHHPSRKTSSLV